VTTTRCPGRGSASTQRGGAPGQPRGGHRRASPASGVPASGGVERLSAVLGTGRRPAATPLNSTTTMGREAHRGEAPRGPGSYNPLCDAWTSRGGIYLDTEETAGSPSSGGADHAATVTETTDDRPRIDRSGGYDIQGKGIPQAGFGQCDFRPRACPRHGAGPSRG
jgi:hypothetical protein